MDVNLDGARALAEKIGGHAVACDVTNAEQSSAALKDARERHGAARIVINCAGVGPAKRIVGRDGPMPLADFERVIAINLIGTFNMMRLVAADMQSLSPLADGERGVIIMTASVAAFEGQIGQAAYSASKGGVAALTLPAAREFAKMLLRLPAAKLAALPGVSDRRARTLPAAALLLDRVLKRLAPTQVVFSALGSPRSRATSSRTLTSTAR